MSRILPLLSSTFCFVVATMPFATAADGSPIVARFTHGGSSATPVTSEVDAWSGAIGDGWTSAWGRSSMTTEVLSSASPVWGNQTRLQITPTSTTGQVNRIYDPSYAAPDPTAPIIVSFDLSIDDLGDFLNTARNHFFIGQSNTASTNPTSNSNWFLYGWGGTDPNAAVDTGSWSTARQGQWNLYSGVIGDLSNVYVPTGITLREDVLYSFTLTLDRVNETYTVFLTDGTDEFQSGSLTFYNDNGNFLSRLVFAQLTEANEQAIYSISNIEIIPEPSSVALVAGAVAGLALLRRRKGGV